MLSRAEAKEKIKLLKEESKPIKTGVTLPSRAGETFDVYRVNIEWLVPNILNDRIAWKIREFEADQQRKLDNENENDIELVYSFIEKETPNENDITLKDLAEKGQQVDAVITNDGKIIDGNRRATLLRKLYCGEATRFNKSIDEFKYLNAIILPGSIDDKEIMALETSIQIGEDKKIGYNPICIYIKIDNLKRAGYNDKQISNYMRESETEIKKKYEVFGLMNDYLDNIGKQNHYSLLDKLEDQFLNTYTIFKKLDNSSYQAEWEYENSDVVDFKQICYDYMRSKYEGKKYREYLLGKSDKTDGVFVQKKVWDEFKKNHENIIEANNPQNEADWEQLGKDKFTSNLNDARKKMMEYLDNQDITSLVNGIETKIDKLKKLVENKNEINTDNLSKLRQASKDIYKIVSEYEKID